MMDYAALFHAFDSETTILTPNRRLSATLHKYFQKQQIQNQQTYWETPDILPLSSWVRRLWQDYTATTFSSLPLLLNSFQELLVWQELLLAAKNSDQLLQLFETAELMQSAWQLLKQWQIDIDHPSFTQTEDCLIFQSLANTWQEKSKKKNWVDSTTLITLVTDLIHEKKIIPTKNIILVGFNELSPLFKTLLNHYQSNNIQVTSFQSAFKTASCQRISLIDAEEELLMMARWANTLLQQNKMVTIGCVIQNLDKVRNRAKQIFSEVFDNHVNSFNISAGQALTRYPIIHSAFQLLKLHKTTIPYELFSYLLASPHLGDAEKERLKRAQFDNLLRQSNHHRLDLMKFLQQTDNKKALSLLENCPLLAKRIKQFFLTLQEKPFLLSYEEWAQLFNDLLRILGWPGERSLSSEEYQIVDSWLKLLKQFSTLGQISQPITIQQALTTLQKLAAKSIFQPQTPEAPVQVLGLLEAAGLSFDYLWVAGMDDATWPPAPKPHPFIPKKLQRELHMPHATSEREFIYCHQLTNQFKTAAQEVIFSHALKNADLILQPSPLIQDLNSITLEALKLLPYEKPSERIYATKSIETLIDDQAPAYQYNQPVRGGVNVIKRQALCPFSAFAEWRLHARELEHTFLGLRAKDRGTMVHKTLEIIWDKLQNQANLIEMSTSALQQLVTDCIEQALERNHSDHTQYLALEKKRLRHLLLDWLQIEKNRAPFKVIAREYTVSTQLNNLQFTMRLDRIDELENGKKLIIDYKTGKNNDIAKWFGERLEEPQLPLYALLDAENTAGIAFAQIAPGEQCFKGVSCYDFNIKGIKADKANSAAKWVEYMTEWNQSLGQLSEDFCQGIAIVDPKETLQTCLYCAFKPLCRINEETIYE